MINIIITDDHALIREGLKKLIEGRMDMQVTAECTSASEAFEAIKTEECDVLVLDINLPDKNGLDLLKELRSNYKNMKVLMLSMHPERMYALRALKLGAAGYMTKSTAPTELTKAIERIWKGGRYVSEVVADYLALEVGSPQVEFMYEKLSDREFQVLLLIGSGESPQGMAKTLAVSLSTISTYRQRILQKMNMSSNQELIRYCIKGKLVD